MPQIIVENLSKSFRVSTREPGVRAAIGSLFSVDTACCVPSTA